MPRLIAALLGLLACRPPSTAPTELAVPTAPRAAEVRYRPWPADGLDAALAARLPDGRADAGLSEATRALLGRMVDPRARIRPEVSSLITARAGYPGPVNYLKLVNTGGFPEELVQRIAEESAGDPVDVALVRRDWSDGVVLWLAGFSRRRASVDPLPRDLPLDASLPLRVDSEIPGQLLLFVATPDGPVVEAALSGEATRWLDLFHTPGPYRVEVVAEREGRAEVVLLFSVFVEQPPDEPPHLAWHPPPPPDPVTAEAELYAALDALREAHGLPPVASFPLYEPLAREHSAFMASAGRVGHQIPGLTAGVAARSDGVVHPKARTYENVAGAMTAEDAHQLVVDSPGHLKNLLCEPCTHAAIGVALEPVLDRPPRLFVTWELLEFPNGPSQRIPPR